MPPQDFVRRAASFADHIAVAVGSGASGGDSSADGGGGATGALVAQVRAALAQIDLAAVPGRGRGRAPTLEVRR
jgi:hypothetical protein